MKTVPMKDRTGHVIGEVVDLPAMGPYDQFHMRTEDALAILTFDGCCLNVVGGDFRPVPGMYYSCNGFIGPTDAQRDRHAWTAIILSASGFVALLMCAIRGFFDFVGMLK